MDLATSRTVHSRVVARQLFPERCGDLGRILGVLVLLVVIFFGANDERRERCRGGQVDVKRRNGECCGPLRCPRFEAIRYDLETVLRFVSVMR